MVTAMTSRLRSAIADAHEAKVASKDAEHAHKKALAKHGPDDWRTKEALAAKWRAEADYREARERLEAAQREKETA
jgi:hypothetical protein